MGQGYERKRLEKRLYTKLLQASKEEFKWWFYCSESLGVVLPLGWKMDNLENLVREQCEDWKYP